jgi:hypothetical protein
LAVFIAFFFVRRQALLPGAAPRCFLFLAAESGEARGELAMIRKTAEIRSSFPRRRESKFIADH